MPLPSPSDKTPTLADVARAAGVSPMTASRALSGKGYASADAKAKVEAATARLGYRPNPLVRALMSEVRKPGQGSGSSIAWLLDQRKPPSAVQEIGRGMRERAESLGHTVQEIQLGDLPARADGIRRLLQARGIYGAVLAPLQHPRALPDFPWDQLAIATVGRSLLRPLLHYTMPHYLHAMERALRELRERGYRRIGFLQDMEMDTRSELGLRLVFEHHCMSQHTDPGLAIQFHDGWKKQDYHRWLQTFKPDAVLSTFPQIRACLEETGIRIPEELGFATLSRRETTPDCAGIEQPFAALGAAAADMVIAQLNRNERGIPARPKAMLLEGDWKEGESLRGGRREG